MTIGLAALKFFKDNYRDSSHKAFFMKALIHLFVSQACPTIFKRKEIQADQCQQPCFFFFNATCIKLNLTAICRTVNQGGEMLGGIVRRGFGVGILLCSMNTLLMQLIVVVGREGRQRALHRLYHSCQKLS